ncbi:MAG: acetyl-CoA carboxylase carboxyltransferase subunit alpha [Chloroflexota bacterium]|nr:acetyl-CoA carboxylase carboxyltransferase subunit alpha [Chloroflexota bacterium]
MSETEVATATGALDPWARVQLARQPERPHTLDYIADLCADFVELHGDRAFRDDPAIVGGPARFAGRTVMVLGHQKGANTKENLQRHFGMPHPEGYHKARRLMRHGEKFGLPLVIFIDTPAADPGLESEERGQAVAIAACIQTLTELRVPVVATIIGEGGSGGALALGVADEVLMLENAIYSVISPEGCASILWKDTARAPEAAAALRITAAELHGFGIVDRVIPEPAPAHEDPHAATAATGRAIREALERLERDYPLDRPGGTDALLAARYAKFRAIGRWREEEMIVGT